MVNRLVSVGDDFNLPDAVNVLDGNLPANLQPAALSATILDSIEVEAPAIVTAEMRPVTGQLESTKTRLAAWGSSTMQNMGDDFQAYATANGMSFHSGGYGGQVAEQILARLGSRLATAPASTIPASGPVVINFTGLTNNSPTWFECMGTLAGVRGNLTKEGGVQPGYTFTRSTAGSAVTVPAGTPFIPEKGIEHRAGLNILNIGKNNLVGSSGASSSVDEMIQWTHEAYQWLSLAAENVLVVGHFVDTTTAAISSVRDNVLAYNAAMKARYGRQYFDVSAVLTGSAIWTALAITPTGTDTSEQALGNKPPSLSLDNAHMSAAAEAYVKDLMVTRIAELQKFAPLDTTSGVLYDYDPEAIGQANATALPVIQPAAGAGARGTLLVASATKPVLNTTASTIPSGHKTVAFASASSEYIESEAVPTYTGPLTVLLVVKAVDSGSTQRLFSTGLPGGGYYSILANTGGGSIEFETQSSGVVGRSGISTGAWHVIVAVFNGSKSSLTVDGGTTTGSLAAGNGKLDTIRLSGNSSHTSQFANGELARCRIYSRALTNAEVLDLTRRMQARYGL